MPTITSNSLREHHHVSTIRWGATLVAWLALASCGGADDPAESDARGCSTLAGMTLTATEASNACTVDEGTADLLKLPVGEVMVPGTASTLCKSGRVLFWNDIGWGYEDSPFTIHVAGAEQVAPAPERDACTPA